MQGAAAAGVIIGPYHFCRVASYDGDPFTSYVGSPFLPGTTPYLDAVSEANDFLDAIVPYYQTGSYLPPVADVENLPDFSSSALEKTFISNWVQIFSDTINATLGSRPIIYTSKSGANTRYTSSVAAQHELWEAWWKGTGTSNPPVASDTPLFGDWLFWQWTDSWSVPGVTGNVDGDVFEGTQAQLEQLRITLAPGSEGPFGRVTHIEEFENGEGFFKWGTNFSGSNFGLLPGTDAQRVTTHAHEGFASQEIDVVGDPNGWFLRHVSGNGSPAANPATNLPFVSDGYVGLWLMTNDSGVTVYLALDDLTSTIERGLGQDVIADGTWHLYEWDLSDDNQWDAWAGGANGMLDGATVTIDSIQFAGAGNAQVYLDGVAHNPDGSLLAALGDFDYDGDVDEEDMHQWQAHFGTASGASFDRGDADGDGDVDGADFLAWQRTYQPTATTLLAAVPEPGSLLLIIVVLGIACSIRRSFPKSQRLSPSHF
ncbi:Lysozyme M1 precursor [Bythopirellula polymerisocia]|uniref:Lysozyme M1 n=1 Tax=Bythopirellula polymerisocia TaxID=2528003 RepID=A0A5C6CZU4_9BACT|nr:Lysozyme M1 precursor [Bythopirellula polymerisocia]